MKKSGKAPLVLKEYPNAKPIKVGKNVEIWASSTYLGKGNSNKTAWSAAYNQNIKN
jgi:hypothetical protein